VGIVRSRGVNDAYIDSAELPRDEQGEAHCICERDLLLHGKLLDHALEFLNADQKQYMLIFGATANCIPWVYVPEILPLHVRAKGTAVGISSNWLWNFFVVMITPTLINNLAWKGYLIFMCLNFAFVPLVVSLDEPTSARSADGVIQFFCYPETSNLTLEEIDWLFYEGKVVRRSRRVAKHGWEHGENWGSFARQGGQGPSPAALEDGSLESKEKEATVEKHESDSRLA
jgi:hypothetical protein